MVKVSICVVTYNNQKEILNLISSIYENTKEVNFEVFLVDNNSSDETVELVEKNYPLVNVVKLSKNLGFGYAHNQVLNKIDSQYHVIVNPDISFNGNVIKVLCDYLDKNEHVKMITPKVLSQDGTEQHLPKKEPRIKYVISGRFDRYFKVFKKIRTEYTMQDFRFKEPTEIEFATGCFMMVRTELFKKINGFDEIFFMYFEDADLSKRVRQYGKIVFYPDTFVVHLWNRASAKKIKFLFIHISSMIKYFCKWKFSRK